MFRRNMCKKIITLKYFRKLKYNTFVVYIIMCTTIIIDAWYIL